MLRAREDRALEVWVGGGRELAGWLTTFKNVPMSMKDILASLDRPDGADNWIQEARGFPLTPVQRTFDSKDLLVRGRDWAQAQVPLYALPKAVENFDALQYTWRVLRLDQDDFDWLFDHPDFVPVDTDIDRDFRATEEGMIEYLRGDLEDAMNYAFIGGSATTYSNATVTSSSSVANGSSMTLEKLQESIAAVQRAMGRR
jgi:hypothetical protein